MTDRIYCAILLITNIWLSTISGSLKAEGEQPVRAHKPGLFDSYEQFIEFKKAIVRQLSLIDINAVTAEIYIKNQMVLQRALQQVFLPEKLKNLSYPVTVDYGLNLEQMIKNGNYDWVCHWVCHGIDAEHFSIRKRGIQNIIIEFVNSPELNYVEAIGENKLEKKVLRKLNEINMRPITFPELLALGAKFPDLQLHFPIPSYGSIFLPFGNRCILYLLGDSHGRHLDSIETRFGPCQLAAVRR